MPGEAARAPLPFNLRWFVGSFVAVATTWVIRSALVRRLTEPAPQYMSDEWLREHVLMANPEQ